MDPETSQLPAAGVAPAQRTGTGPENGDASLTEAVATLRKRRWIWIAAATLGLLYGFYKAITQPRLYRATSTIQVHNGASNEYKLDSDFYYGDDSETRMSTEVLILKSDTLLYTVARDMNLANNPDFIGLACAPKCRIDDPQVHAAVVGTLQGNLIITIIPRTQIMTVTYSSLGAKLSADIVNQLIADYINRAFQAPVHQTELVSSWLSNDLDDLKTQLESTQEQMLQLERKLGVLAFDSQHNQLQSSLDQLLTAEGAARIARIAAEERYQMIKNMDPNTVDESIETTPGTLPGELTGLRSQRATLQAQYAQLTGPGGLGTNHPRARQLRQQIDQITAEINTEHTRLETQARENFLAAQKTEQATEQELDAQKAQAYSQGDEMVRYTLLQREYEQNRALYDALKQRLETAKIESGLGATEVDQVDKALPPVSPTMQSTSSLVISNGLFFLLGGIVLAFIVENLDTGLRSVQEMEAVMGMPSLAVIPRARRPGVEQAAAMSVIERNLTVLNQPKSQFTEAIRSLRTSLLLASAGHPPKFILFTSATPSEGKTNTAGNLACILSQADARVILIDADLRRPSVHHRFGLAGRVGLTTVLAGAASLEEAIQQVPELPNLDILPSGPVPPFPTEMLSSEAMRSVLDRLAEKYTYVVIDSPPILSVTDGIILSRSADAVVLVVRHGKSNRNIMRRTRDLLARSGAPVAGLVLNAVDLNSADYYDYYGYSGYSYGSTDGGTWETQTGQKNAGPAGRSR
jgi:capsular exopolysaccharide synthesis family protein